MASKSARQYAKAIFESYEAVALEEVVQSYMAISKAFSSDKSFQEFFVNPAVSYQNKLEILESISDDQKIKNTLHILLDNNKVKILPEIACELKGLYDAYKKNLQLVVTTAKETNAEEKENILNYLKSNFGNEVAIRWERDASLIGGFTVKSGDQLLDSSVSGALSKIKSSLTL